MGGVEPLPVPTPSAVISESLQLPGGPFGVSRELHKQSVARREQVGHRVAPGYFFVRMLTVMCRCSQL